MAWTRKSSSPQVFSMVAKTASMEASSVTSQGSTISAPTDSASGRTRRSRASPWKVNASSAPCSRAAVAMPQAMDRSLATPMTRPRLPAINEWGSHMPAPRWRSDWISLQDVRHPTPTPPGVNAAPSQYSHFPAGSCCTIASFGRGGGSSRNVAMKRPDPTGNLRNLLPFAAYCGRRFMADGCLRRATGLSYASLLAIVPVLAICFGLLAAFPAFERLRFEAQVYLFQNLVPNAGMEVSDQIATFVENARSMTGIGTLALLVTALLLLSTINGAFNAIWRVTEPRPLMMPDGLLDDSDHQPAAARCVVVAHQLRLRQRGDGAGRARLRPDAPAALPVCHRRLHAALRGGAGDRKSVV